MEVKRPQIERALSAPPDSVRLFLLCGPDEAGSRALAERLAAAMGPEAERIDLAASSLKADPPQLAFEAAAGSLFGGARWIRIDGGGEELVPAVTALLEAPAAGNPVVIVAGDLRKSSELRKRVGSDPAAMLFVSYVPEGADADRMVTGLARDLGLRVSPDIARMLAQACGADRAVLARELEKFALYLDAAPERPCELTIDDLQAIGAGFGEADVGRLVDMVLGGAPDRAERELTRLSAEGIDGIPLLRALLRRLHLLVPLRAEVERGNSIDIVLERSGKTLFWKDKPAVGAQLQKWTSARLATAIDRVAGAERALKSSRGVGPSAAEAELIAIARAAQRR